MLPGKIRGAAGCAQRVMTPNPNNCSRFPAGRKSRSRRQELLRFRVAPPASCGYNNPNNSSAFPRSRRWRPRCPDYPEHFPLGGRMPDPAKRSDHSAGVSLSAVTGICSASMGISAGVTSFMRFLARSINSCSCSTI